MKIIIKEILILFIIILFACQKENEIPVANAGNDQFVKEGKMVTLDGSKSYDPDSDELTYQWIVPEEIELSFENIVKPYFTAPEITTDTQFPIILVVSDGQASSIADTVIINILNEEKYLTFITAGQTEGEGIKYVDFEPDEKLGDCDDTYKACLNLDMNNDSINDFYLYFINDHSLNQVYWNLCIVPYGDNSIYFSQTTPQWGDTYFAEALLDGDTIGLNSNWINSKIYLFAKQQTTNYYGSPPKAVTTTTRRGQWMSNKDIYIGVKIIIDGMELFGWIDMKSTTVFRYAITEPY